jgi:3'-phosphoadenosine 5'-phosphosulfate sulfotransferase (PAPS reductase)/FAD synthetase
LKGKIETALDRLDRIIQEYKPIAVFGLFSGGHDSFSATYVASQHPAFTAAVHINTGIGVRATREYVRETCRTRGWKLLEYAAAENVNAKGWPDPMVFREIVIKHGFPGPASHGWMYQLLKERQLRRLERDYGATARGKNPRRVLYVSGCRNQESERRMGNTEEMHIEGRRIWAAPIHDWSKLDTTDCLQYAGQPRNPVVDAIHKSGECLCGAFAKKRELEELLFWPITREAGLEIQALEREVVPIHGRGWGERPQRGGKKQLRIPGFLCWSCDKVFGPETPVPDGAQKG